MLARVHTYILVGIDAHPCEVEVDVGKSGQPKVVLVGLPQAAVRESIERVHRACENSGFVFPESGPLAINLAPADVKKEGPSLDLPIAIGLLRATGALKGDTHNNYLIAGELALDGRVRKIKGALSLAMLARQTGKKGVLIPAENSREAAVVEGVDVIPVHTLGQASAFLAGHLEIEPFALADESHSASRNQQHLDFADVRGQEAVKRAITVASAGGHNILLIGPPGTGKTMLAQRIPSILPPLSRTESLETTRVYSSVGMLPEGVSLLDVRPVRTPHHSASAPALVGGGTGPKPGEVSLAHHGVLFLDELPEFNRSVLEMLRQPLESGHVTIARSNGTITFPAKFMMVAAMNPTASGYEDKSKAPRRDKYMAKISGPLLDRIDIHAEVPAVPYAQLTSKTQGTDSASMAASVATARQLQHKRLGGSGSNASMNTKQLNQYCDLSPGCLKMMKNAMDELGLSARAYDKVRKVARTIADMAGADAINEDHLAEAIAYRVLDRKF